MADLLPHETLELHQLISATISEIKNFTTTINNINDIDLKNYTDKYITSKKKNLESIQKLLDSITIK